MEISVRDWALAMFMIQRLHEICEAHNEMFGKLNAQMGSAGLFSAEQMMALENDWQQSYATNVQTDELTSTTMVEAITDTGVLKGQRRVTLEDAFTRMKDEALERLESESDEE